MLNKILPIVAALIIAGLVVWIGFTATADGHRTYTAWHAEQETYNRYNKLCGTAAWGWTWCHRRQTALHSSAYGDHSWQVRYTWMEAKIGTTYGCGVLVQFYTHTHSFSYIRGPSCATK